MPTTRKTIPGVHLIFQRFNPELNENEYLLHKRIGTSFYDDHYSVPGGHIDDYETPEQCVIREGREELGITISAEDLEFKHVIYRIREPEDQVRTDFCFVVKKWAGELTNQEPEKHEDLQWYPLSAFPEPMVPYVKKAILDIENGVGYAHSIL